MKLPRGIAIELVVAGLAVAAAGAFTHAAVSGQAAPIFAAVEQQANELGKKIFLGKGNCATCHGQNLKGGVLAPNLTDGEWLNGDGSLEMIQATVKQGVTKPKKYPAPMPPMGGAKLNDEEVQAVAGFVKEQSAPAKRP
jgi:cbb3-type cytochrome c oxidase subunit III